jgi:hypothetical protein
LDCRNDGADGRIGRAYGSELFQPRHSGGAIAKARIDLDREQRRAEAVVQSRPDPPEQFASAFEVAAARGKLRPNEQGFRMGGTGPEHTRRQPRCA